MKSDQYYVYVYIDPRNFQEFYYGKGCGSRKLAHLQDDSQSLKSKTIQDIRNEGLAPIIKIIARNLTEEQALLVEKTLIWKLGKSLTNISSGHFARNFRPANTLHKELYGFDYENGIYYVNVGEGDHRNWDDCKKYGFLASGQNWEKWGKKIYSLNVGDLVVAYLKDHGYVGVGTVNASACPAIDYRIHERPLSKSDLKQPRLLEVSAPIKDEEHLLGITWITAVDRSDAKWKKNGGLFTSQLVVASLEGQPTTIDFIEKAFKVDLRNILLKVAGTNEAA